MSTNPVHLSVKFKPEQPILNVVARFGAREVYIARGPSTWGADTPFRPDGIMHYATPRMLDEAARTLAFMFPHLPELVTIPKYTSELNRLRFNRSHLERIQENMREWSEAIEAGIHETPVTVYRFDRFFKSKHVPMYEVQAMLEHPAFGQGNATPQISLRARAFRGGLHEAGVNTVFRESARKVARMLEARGHPIPIKTVETEEKRELDLFLPRTHSQRCYQLMKGTSSPVPDAYRACF